MKSPVRCIAHAVDQLSQTGSSIGIVRQARRALAYIQTPGFVVAVEHTTSLLSPNGLYLDPWVDLTAWRVGMRVLIESGRLVTDGQEFTWGADTAQFDGMVGPLAASSEACAQALFNILGAHGDADCAVCRLVEDHELWGRSRLLSALHALAVRSPCQPCGAESVNQLLGLGPGLTPASDDLICGVLLAQRALGIDVADALSPAALALRAAVATTPLSATWLQQAAEGRAIAPLQAMLAESPSSQAWHASVRSLLAIGATTGRSMATGVALALIGHAGDAGVRANACRANTCSRP